MAIEQQAVPVEIANVELAEVQLDACERQV
jgi:hypothetical protein